MPVMAHPPAIVSDLSLSEFLNQITEFNRNHESHSEVTFSCRHVGPWHARNAAEPFYLCPAPLNCEIY